MLSGPSGAGKSTLHAQPVRQLPRRRAAASWCATRRRWSTSPPPIRAPSWRCGTKPSAMSASSCAWCRACRARHRRRGADRPRRRAGRGARQRRATLLLRLNIPRRLHALPPATFSGGEQQRVNLARGFIGGHPMLLLDEPTASLDAENRAVVVAMIQEAKARGTAIVGDLPRRRRARRRSPTGCSR